MNVECKVQALVVGKKENDVRGEKYYSVSVVQNGEAGMVSCNVDVFNSVFQNPADFRQYVFKAVYRDGQYKSLRLVGIDTTATDRLSHLGINGAASNPDAKFEKK